MQPIQPPNLEIEINGKTYKIRRVTPLDFLESGLDITTFKTKKWYGNISKLDQMRNSVLQAEAPDGITEETHEKHKQFLNVAIIGFDYDAEREFLGEKSILLFTIAVVYNQAVHDRVITANKNIVLMAHSIASAYGGTPWDHLTGGLEQFFFNYFALTEGVEEEKRIRERLKQ